MAMSTKGPVKGAKFTGWKCSVNRFMRVVNVRTSDDHKPGSKFIHSIFLVVVLLALLTTTCCAEQQERPIHYYQGFNTFLKYNPIQSERQDLGHQIHHETFQQLKSHLIENTTELHQPKVKEIIKTDTENEQQKGLQSSIEGAKSDQQEEIHYYSGSYHSNQVDFTEGQSKNVENKNYANPWNPEVPPEDLEGAPCDSDDDCYLPNFNIAMTYESPVVNAPYCEIKNESSGVGNNTISKGHCTCGEYCVSYSQSSTGDGNIFYYCGPCGRVGSTCGVDVVCTHLLAECASGYCQCTFHGSFFDIYYCVVPYDGYEKALQVAIATCIFVAACLLVASVYNALFSRPGRFPSYLERLILRRMAAGTRESPPGDTPPKYDDVVGGEQQPPSYQDALGMEAQRTQEGEDNLGYENSGAENREITTGAAATNSSSSDNETNGVDTDTESSTSKIQSDCNTRGMSINCSRRSSARYNSKGAETINVDIKDTKIMHNQVETNVSGHLPQHDDINGTKNSNANEYNSDRNTNIVIDKKTGAISKNYRQNRPRSYHTHDNIRYGHTRSDSQHTVATIHNPPANNDYTQAEDHHDVDVTVSRAGKDQGVFGNNSKNSTATLRATAHTSDKADEVHENKTNKTFTCSRCESLEVVTTVQRNPKAEVAMRDNVVRISDDDITIATRFGNDQPITKPLRDDQPITKPLRNHQPTTGSLRNSKDFGISTQF